MKRKYFFCIVLIFIISLMGCSSNIGRSKAPKTPQKLEELIEMSPIIVECKATGSQKRISYNGIDFLKVDVIVKDIIRDGYGIKNDSTIALLQPDDATPIKKSETLILLLDKYEGPVTTDSYVIIGSEKGQMVISENHIKPKTIKSGRFYDDVVKNDMESFKTLIRNKPFISKQRSKEQIEIETNNEKDLYESSN